MPIPTLVVAGASFLGGLATSSLINSRKSQAMAVPAGSLQACRNQGAADGRADAIAGRPLDPGPSLGVYYKTIGESNPIPMALCSNAYVTEYAKAYVRFNPSGAAPVLSKPKFASTPQPQQGPHVAGDWRHW